MTVSTKQKGTKKRNTASIALGQRIRARRNELGWSLNTLGRRSELGASYLCDLERGMVGASVDSLMRISGAIGIPIDQLVAGESDRPNHAEIVQLPPHLHRWALTANVPYRHATCLYWCARTIVSNRAKPDAGALDEWDWAKFYEVLKPWLEGGAA